MNRRALLVLGSLFMFAFIVILGCGGDDGPTNPGGGGGGGGGPTFNFTFPATGASHSLMFMDVGTWTYHCTPHGTQSSGMHGDITVDAGSANDSVLIEVGPGNALVFSPSSATVKVHGIVRWVNSSSMTNHTVTRP